MGLQYALMYFSDVMGRLDLKNTEEIPKIMLAGLQKGITHILYLHVHACVCLHKLAFASICTHMLVYDCI